MKTKRNFDTYLKNKKTKSNLLQRRIKSFTFIFPFQGIQGAILANSQIQKVTSGSILTNK